MHCPQVSCSAKRDSEYSDSERWDSTAPPSSRCPERAQLVESGLRVRAHLAGGMPNQRRAARLRLLAS